MMPLVSSPGYSQNEIQRQNRITQRIIANFLERKLFPYRRPQHEVPTIDEILPAPNKDPPEESNSDRGGGGRKRYKPKTALELLRKGQRFRPANPKYSLVNQTESESELNASDEEDRDKIRIEDYYDEDYVEGDENEEENQYGEDEEENDGRSRRHNATSDSLRSGARGGAIGDYDDYMDNNYDIESLQSVESEHLDLFYRNNNNYKRFHGGHNRFYLDDDFYEGRCHDLTYSFQLRRAIYYLLLVPILIILLVLLVHWLDTKLLIFCEILQNLGNKPFTWWFQFNCRIMYL